MEYRHYTLESTTQGLADLLIDEYSVNDEDDFSPYNYIVNPDAYETMTDQGIVEIDGNSVLPEYLVNQ